MLHKQEAVNSQKAALCKVNILIIQAQHFKEGAKDNLIRF